MAATERTCDLCNQPLDTDSHLVLRRLTGFAATRGAAGGVHGVRDKVWLDEYAHVGCLDRKKQGHRFGQQELGGMAA